MKVEIHIYNSTKFSNFILIVKIQDWEGGSIAARCSKLCRERLMNKRGYNQATEP